MLKIGVTIYLETEIGDVTEKYKAKLVELNDKFLYIDYPINEATNKTSFFFDGGEFKASFLCKDNNVYMFDTAIVGRKKEKIPMLILQYPGNDSLVKIQRREFVRIDTAVDTAVHPLVDEFPPFTTVTLDISAGGAAIILPNNHQLHNGSKVNCWFVLRMSSGEYLYEKILCKVIRIVPSFDENERDKAPLQFLNMNEQKKQVFLRFCFEQQLLMRRKGIE